MNLTAVSHSCTSKDCFCIQPGKFLFRIRTARGDIAKIILHYQDKYLPLSIQDTREAVPMLHFTTDNTLDYWEVLLEFDVVCLRYWFELIDQEGKRAYYSNYLFWDAPLTDTDDMFDCPQNLREEECFLTPKWAENKVLYQVFPSRFATSRDVPEAQWYTSPITAQDNLYGDLRGIINHLEHLRQLGVDILYMTPLFRSDSCHKYDTIDYYTIDPSFGTNEDFRELVEKAHAMGIRVILDGVFNHTSQDFFAFADIRKNGRASKYLDWYFIKDFPLRSKWGEKPNYKTFSYFGDMPKLNIKNPEVGRYVLDVALYWLRQFHIDGWRLDVGDEISHVFWKQFRKEIKAEFPDALIIGEIWHHAEDFLQGDEWDTVMNYPFYQNVLRLAVQDKITVSQFAGNLGFLRGQLHPKVNPLLWNLVDSHDTPRILHHCGGDKARMKLVAALQLLLPGMPMIYYGDEYAMDGGQDPDCRRGMLWDEARQDTDMFRWYQALIRLRKQHPELLGRNCRIETDDRNGILIRSAGGFHLVFHCKKRSAQLPQFAGKTDCITGSPFDGTLTGFGAVVIQI